MEIATVVFGACNLLVSIIKIITPTLLENLSPSLNVRLEDLHRKMSKIRKLVKKPATDPNLWQRQIKEVTYDLEDLMDDIEFEERRSKVRNLHSNLPDPAIICGIKEDLDEIHEILLESRAKWVVHEEREQGTMSIFNGDEFIGREDEIDKIVAFLLSENNNDNNTYSIVGIGGVGKTALAQEICRHEELKERLVVKWVHVGFKFDLKKILVQIGRDMNENNSLEMQRIILKEKLGTETRYIFVLDDLWEMSRDDWSSLNKAVILDINKGNKVLITTRHHGIAKMAAKDRTVFLKPLEPAECLLLIEKHVTSTDLLSCEIRKEIIKECEGVPMAAITLGRELSKDTSRVSDIWSTVNLKDKGNIMNSLKFSYDYLPPRLKDCFAYHVVNDLHKERLTQMWTKERLTQMWTAQGFIKQTQVDNTFKTLKHASFFHDVTKDIFTGTQFKVLKLFRTLIFLVSKEYADTTVSKITGVTRHVSLSPQRHAQEPQESRMLGQLRTVIGLPEIKLRSQFKGLRVLVLFDVRFESKDISFSNLKHLRYLELSNNGNLEELPKFLGELLFLETLRVDMCKKLKSIHRKILPRSLKSLRINRCDKLTERYESKEGRDDVSWIKEVYLNGVLLVNPVPNAELASPSSSSGKTDVLTEGPNGGTTEVEQPAREETSASSEEPSNVSRTSSTQLLFESGQNSIADPPDANGEGSSTHHQSDGTPIGKSFGKYWFCCMHAGNADS